MRSYVWTAGRDSGNVSGPGCAMRSWSAGTASATSSPPARTADSGRPAQDAVDDGAPDPALAASRRRRPRSGTRPRSTLSPSRESSAGSTVSEPSIAIATTAIVAIANEAKTRSPVRNMPAIAVITVRPEISTARPEVAAATSMAAWVLRPAARSSRARRR